MCISSRLLASCATLSLLAAAPAIAADYDPPIYIEEAPEYVPVEIGSGWYLRGDVSYSIDTRAHDEFEYRTFDALAGTYGSSTFDTGGIEDEFSFGGGVGYHLNDFFRADVTLDVGQLRFDGTTSSAAPCLPGIDYLGTACRSEDSATAETWSGLINGYVDLGTISGFTPYVGGGVGYTYVKWRGLDSNHYCVDDVGACPDPTALVDQVSHGRTDDWRFTYAAMAGVAYGVTDNMKIDLGYRYRHISGGDMFGWDDASSDAGATGNQGRDSSLSQHQVRVGLRYDLW
jgi:opacity protein-like surface antigen